MAPGLHPRPAESECLGASAWASESDSSQMRLVSSQGRRVSPDLSEGRPGPCSAQPCSPAPQGPQWLRGSCTELRHHAPGWRKDRKIRLLHLCRLVASPPGFLEPLLSEEFHVLMSAELRPQVFSRASLVGEQVRLANNVTNVCLSNAAAAYSLQQSPFLVSSTTETRPRFLASRCNGILCGRVLGL